MSFFACYLLTPVNAPKRMRCTYVGFTVSPTRRIRQHNGEIANGAWRTSKYRPWEMVAIVYGFPSKFHALQFEYAWQHPYQYKHTKERLKRLMGQKGMGHMRSVKRKVIELHELLHAGPWMEFPLAVCYTSEFFYQLALSAPNFMLPTHVRCEVAPLIAFAPQKLGALGSEESREEDIAEDEMEDDSLMCSVCELEIQQEHEETVLACYASGCSMKSHAGCLEMHFYSLYGGSDEDVGKDHEHVNVPSQGACPVCESMLDWHLVIENCMNRSSRNTSGRAIRDTQKQSSTKLSTENPSRLDRLDKSFEEIKANLHEKRLSCAMQELHSLEHTPKITLPRDIEVISVGTSSSDEKEEDIERISIEQQDHQQPIVYRYEDETDVFAYEYSNNDEEADEDGHSERVKPQVNLPVPVVEIIDLSTDI